MSSTYPNADVTELGENKELKQLEDYIDDIILTAIEKIHNLDLHRKDEHISRNTEEIIRDSNEVQNRIVIPLENQLNRCVNKFHFLNNKEDKATDPGIFNFVGSFHPDPFENKPIPQTNLIVYPTRYIISVIDESGEIIFRNHSVTRNEFLLNTLIILSLMLIVTFSLVFALVYVPAMGNFIKADTQMFYFISIMDLILFIVLLSFDEIRKKSPYNYFLMAIFSLCNGYLLGYLYIQYTTDKLLYSLAGTFIILFIVGSISWLYCFDLTSSFFLVDMLIILAIAYLMIASIYYWITRSQVLLHFFFIIFVSVISLALFHHFQLMFGRGKYAMNREEEVLSAFVMYFQIMIVFATFPKLIVGPQR